MESSSLHMLNKPFTIELLSPDHHRKNLTEGIDYTSHEVAESQTDKSLASTERI